MKKEELDVLAEACRKAVKETCGPMTKPAAIDALVHNVVGRLTSELLRRGLTIAKLPAKDAKERLARELFIAKHGMAYEEYIEGRTPEELERIQAIRILDELASPVLVALENLGVRL